MDIKVLQLHKRSSYEFRFIQDKFAVSPDLRCCAIADGTTQSFRSELWSEKITGGFVEKPLFDPDQLIVQLKAKAREFQQAEFKFSPNPAYASLERNKQKKGGTAAFTGVELMDDGNLSIISSGDCNVFLYRAKKLTGELFADYESLDASKFFLNSEALTSDVTDASYFVTKSLRVRKDDLVIIATDALSRLLLKFPDTVHDFLAIGNFEGLLKFCLSQWENKHLEEDDITAIVVSLNGNKLTEILPHPGFNFPREEEKEFIPFTDDLEQLNEEEMQQLNSSLNQISNELSRLKKRSKTQETLLIILIFICVVNIAALFFLRQDPKSIVLPANNSEKQQSLQQQRKIKEQEAKAENPSEKESDSTTSPVKSASGEKDHGFVPVKSEQSEKRTAGSKKDTVTKKSTIKRS